MAPQRMEDAKQLRTPFTVSVPLGWALDLRERGGKHPGGTSALVREALTEWSAARGIELGAN